MKRTTKAKREAAIVAAEARIMDIFAGACGEEYDLEMGDMVMQLGAGGLSRFLQALVRAFNLARVSEDAGDHRPALAYWFMYKFQTPRSAAEWIIESREMWP